MRRGVGIRRAFQMGLGDVAALEHGAVDFAVGIKGHLLQVDEPVGLHVIGHGVPQPEENAGFVNGPVVDAYDLGPYRPDTGRRRF